MPFSRTEEGKIYQRPFGGMTTHYGKGIAQRTCAAADRTGHAMLHTLYQQSLAHGATVFVEYFALDLIFDTDGSCIGVLALDMNEGTMHFFRAHGVVLATGGMSYPATGSDGSGYGLARQAGHRITPLRPSLVRVDCRDPFCADLSGLSLKNVALSLWRQGGKKPLYKELGEMLFTHTGVSGPLVLSASAYMDGAAGDYAMAVDLKPGLTPEQLDARLLRDLDDNKNRDLGNTLIVVEHDEETMQIGRASCRERE